MGNKKQFLCRKHIYARIRAMQRRLTDSLLVDSPLTRQERPKTLSMRPGPPPRFSGPSRSARLPGGNRTGITTQAHLVRHSGPCRHNQRAGTDHKIRVKCGTVHKGPFHAAAYPGRRPQVQGMTPGTERGAACKGHAPWVPGMREVHAARQAVHARGGAGGDDRA